MRREVFGEYSDKVIVLALLAVTLGCGTMLAGEVSHAETTTANATVTVAEACTMTAVVDSVHSAIVNPGQYVDEIGQTTLKVVCNDASGYAIYAVGNANNEYGNNKLLANLGGTLNPIYDIATGTATSGSTSNWAMKVNAVSGAYAPTIQNSFGSYHEVPNAYMKVAQLNSNTDTSTGSSITSTYAAFVKSDQPAGSYNGKVKYTMVHPISETPLHPETTQTGKICYYPNGSNVEGTMGCQTITASDTSATLLASNFSREGYGFAGWSKTFDYSDTTGYLGPQEDITFTAGEYTGDNPGLSLYARWIKSAGNLQNWSGCSSLQSGIVTALTDQRDNQTYAIAKLADSKCWMIENLRLDNSATLTTINTNNPLNDGTNVTLKHSYSDTETHNTLSASQDPTATAWCNSNSASCDDKSMLFTGNTTNRKTDSANNDGNIYSYGNYYNWYSATAGRGTYSFSANNNSVVGDLCPAGWHLPKGGSSTNATNSDFWQLGLGTMGAAPSNNSSYQSSETNAAGKTATAAFRSYPNNFVYSGYVYGGSVYDRGSGGSFWSSTADSSDLAYSLFLYSSGVNPGTGNNGKYPGRIVRCVASGV